MRAQRIKTGFHRIGVVGASVCAFPAVMVFVARLVGFGPTNGADKFAFVGVMCLVAAAIFYGLARALGWIIAGFVGDGENSN
jgi:hypothetical protein